MAVQFIASCTLFRATEKKAEAEAEEEATTTATAAAEEELADAEAGMGVAAAAEEQGGAEAGIGIGVAAAAPPLWASLYGREPSLELTAAAESAAPPPARAQVERCRLTVSKAVLTAPTLSALEPRIS